MQKRALAALPFALLLSLSCSTRPALETLARPALVERLEAAIEHELADKRLPALSIALVDGQDIVWSAGFGEARPGVPARADTVYRVGSVSKLFTDVAVMQLVEQGELDLDAPITTYLPDFRPQNPFGGIITLRQLMCHHAGLVREPPVGNYFDASAPTLAATVASLNSTALVYPPSARIKYSNAGVSVVGYVLERMQGVPFTRYVQQAVLDPLGARNSAFEPTARVKQSLADARMWTRDGRETPAPTFELGIQPAGCLYATVTDLGAFLACLFAGGETPHGRLLERATIEQMWEPQFAPADARRGFGLGFALGELAGERRVGHGGAIYGFATDLAALPDQQLGCAVVATVDCSNATVERISDYALRLMLAEKRNEPLPDFAATQPIPPKLVERLAGRWSDGHDTLELERRGDDLLLRQGDSLDRLRAWDATRLVVDDRAAFGAELTVDVEGGERLRFGGREYTRVPDGIGALGARPAPPPERWVGLIGEYGWDHNVLYLLERDGELHALIEWFFEYPLREVSDDVFAFPDFGLYHGEKLVFERGADGFATRVVAAQVLFERRAVGPRDGETFTIEPQRPLAELKQAALAAEPPHEAAKRAPELVDLATLDPTLRFDVRYATTNNFMQARFYDEPRAFLQRPAAEALVRAHRALEQHGYGLLIHDAYRPWYVTKMFWDGTPEALRDFVADPSQGSRHNRGCAVDVTLYDRATGAPAQMVGGYDEMSPRSFPHYPGGTSLQRWQRDLLRAALEAEGFRVYVHEWWHFDFDGWEEWPILDRTFAELAPK